MKRNVVRYLKVKIHVSINEVYKIVSVKLP
jgi:hypothetical protein